MDWSGHATSLLSLPPFVASTQRYVRFENMWPDANMDSIKLAEYRSPVELVPSSDEELDMTADESSLEFSYDDLFAFDRYYDEGVENDEQHRDDNAELGVAEGDHMTQMMDAEMMEAPMLTPVLCHSSRGTDILEVPGVRSSSPTAQNREPPSCSRPVMAHVDPHAAPTQNKLETFLPPAPTTRNLLVPPQPDHQSNRTSTYTHSLSGSHIASGTESAQSLQHGTLSEASEAQEGPLFCVPMLRQTSKCRAAKSKFHPLCEALLLTCENGVGDTIDDRVIYREMLEHPGGILKGV